MSWFNAHTKGNMEPIDFVRQWVAAAIADGWKATPMYNSEGMDRAVRLTREDDNLGQYEAQAIMRPDWPKSNNYASLSLWGPDKLALDVPKVYSWETIQRNMKVCGYCEQEVDEVRRLGFAGRACNACREKHRAKVEFPGWDN